MAAAVAPETVVRPEPATVRILSGMGLEVSRSEEETRINGAPVLTPSRTAVLDPEQAKFAGDNLSDGPNRATRREDAKKLQRTLRPIKIAGARMREKERLDAARLHNHLKPGLDA